MNDLGHTLRQARKARGLSLSAMAIRTGYSRSYLGNIETGTRQATADVVRAYEKALGDNMNRRNVLIGMVAALSTAAVPDEAVDVARQIAVESGKLLSTVQTTHATDQAIGAIVARDAGSVAALYRWMSKGSAVLRVNSTGILGKIGSPSVDDDVARALAEDSESRHLYLTAVTSRILAMPWPDADSLVRSGQALPHESAIAAFARESQNQSDSGARWCSIVMLARTRPAEPDRVRTALIHIITAEPSREILRAAASALAGINPANPRS